VDARVFALSGLNQPPPLNNASSEGRPVGGLKSKLMSNGPALPS
jgi:hypothetical protein